jgi:hypothetical protein
LFAYFRQKYNEFVLCMKKSGGDEDACDAQRQLADHLCPSEWVSEKYIFVDVEFNVSSFCLGNKSFILLWGFAPI